MESKRKGISGDYESGLLTDTDKDRIADAIAQGILKSREQGKEESKKTPWLFAVLVLLVIIGLGVWGFTTRPPQDLTFNGSFDPGSEIRTGTDPEIGHLISATVIRVKFEGYHKPITLKLSLTPEQANAFAAQFDTYHQPGVPIVLDGPTLTLNFDQPTKLIVNAEKVGTVIVERSSDVEESSLIQLSFASNVLESDEDSGPEVSVTILQPQSETYNFSATIGDREPVQFSLQPVRISEESIVTMLLSNNPRKRAMGERVSLSFDKKVPEFQASLNELSNGIDYGRNFGEQIIEIKNMPGGVLSLGPITETLASDEHVLITLRNPQSVSIEEQSINIHSNKETCVISAIRDERIELLPQRFDMWPDVGQELWRWGAVSLSTMLFLLYARKKKWLPS